MDYKERKKCMPLFDHVTPSPFITDPEFGKTVFNEISPFSKISMTKEIQSNLQNQVVFAIDDALTDKECDFLVHHSNKNYESLEKEYLKEDRDSTRALIECKQTADILYSRLGSVISQLPKNLIPMGFNNHGTWSPSSINSCFRFSKYKQSSTGFQTHRDGSFVKTPSERSIMTVLIYLSSSSTSSTSSSSPSVENGNKSDTDQEKEEKEEGGGETIFYSSSNFDKDRRIKDENKIAIVKIIPKKGRVVLFNHEILHKGAPTTSNEKYIIRTDLIFKRNYSSSPPPLISWRDDSMFLEAISYYQKAFFYELRGKVKQSSECYEKGLALRISTLQNKPKEPSSSNYLDKCDVIVHKWQTIKIQRPPFTEFPFHSLNYFLPSFISHSGIVNKFICPGDYFSDWIYAYLRVIAIKTIFLFGHSENNKFVLSYNRDNGYLTYCNMDDLIMAFLDPENKKIKITHHQQGQNQTEDYEEILTIRTDMFKIERDIAFWDKDTQLYRVTIPPRFVASFYHAAHCCGPNLKHGYDKYSDIHSADCPVGREEERMKRERIKLNEMRHAYDMQQYDDKSTCCACMLQNEESQESNQINNQVTTVLIHVTDCRKKLGTKRITSTYIGIGCL